MASDYKAQARAAKQAKLGRMGLMDKSEQKAGDASSRSVPAGLNTNTQSGKAAPAAAVDGSKSVKTRLGMGQRRAEYANGGRVGKGKTNINIIIAPQGGQQAPAGGAMPVPPPLPPGAAGPPAGPAPAPAGGGIPPGLAAALGGGGGPGPGIPVPPGQKRGGRIQAFAKGGAVKAAPNSKVSITKAPKEPLPGTKRADGGRLPGEQARKAAAWAKSNDTSLPRDARYAAIKESDRQKTETGYATDGVQATDGMKKGGVAKAAGGRTTNMSRRFAQPQGKAGTHSGVGRLNQAKAYARKAGSAGGMDDGDGDED